jgi:hypothetical protein
MDLATVVLVPGRSRSFSLRYHNHFSFGEYRNLEFFGNDLLGTTEIRRQHFRFVNKF